MSQSVAYNLNTPNSVRLNQNNFASASTPNPGLGQTNLNTPIGVRLDPENNLNALRLRLSDGHQQSDFRVVVQRPVQPNDK